MERDPIGGEYLSRSTGCAVIIGIMFFAGFISMLFQQPENEVNSERSSESQKQEVKRPTIPTSLAASKYEQACRSMDLFRVRLISSVNPGPFENRVTVTLGSAWYELSKPQQEDIALQLWQVWAQIQSPDNLDDAHIKFLSPAGRDLGGSSIFGSRIKLKQ